MTLEVARHLFQKGATLSFNGITVYFRDNRTYNFVSDDISVDGTYEVLQLSGKVYLRTEPPIVSGIKDLHLETYLEGLPLTIKLES